MTLPIQNDPDVAFCLQELRQGDRDRYLATLLAPALCRPALIVLHAFKLEIEKTHAVVSEPMLGQIRLQWWRESLDGIYAGTPRRHAVVTPLATIIEGYGLARGPFDRIVDAHERDLDPAPFADIAALEAYCADADGALFELAQQSLGGGNDLAAGALSRSAGIGSGIAGLLRRMAFNRRSGPLPIPADIAANHGLDPEAVRNVAPTDQALAAAVADVAAVAAGHLAAARGQARRQNRRVRKGLLPVATARGILGRLEIARYNVFDSRVAEPAPGEIWRLLRASLLGAI